MITLYLNTSGDDTIQLPNSLSLENYKCAVIEMSGDIRLKKDPSSSGNGNGNTPPVDSGNDNRPTPADSGNQNTPSSSGSGGVATAGTSQPVNSGGSNVANPTDSGNGNTDTTNPVDSGNESDNPTRKRLRRNIDETDNLARKRRRRNANGLNGKKSLYLCSDICEDSMLQTTKLPILRSVYINPKTKKVNRAIENLIWLKVARPTIDSVRLYISDEFGIPVSLVRSNLQCTLVFVPIRKI